MDRQITPGSVGGAGSKTCGIVNKQVLVIELSWASNQLEIKIRCGLASKNSGAYVHAHVCGCMHLCAHV